MSFIIYLFCSKVHKKLIYLTNLCKILVIKKKFFKKIYRFERFDYNGRRGKGLGQSDGDGFVTGLNSILTSRPTLKDCVL